MAFEDWAEGELSLVETGIYLQRPSSHQSLFKYIGLNTKTSWGRFYQTLENSELVGSTAHSLNDPFELSPFIFDDLRPKVIAKIIGESGIMERLQGKEWSPDEKYADVDTYRKSAQEYLNALVRHYRILSFCERSDSPLLWSHYANSYKGACIHFLGRAFVSREIHIGRVAYAAFRPTIPLSLALSLSQRGRDYRRYGSLRAEIERAYFFTKALDWSYEGEIRIIYNSNSNNNVGFDSDGLLSIILGPRMAERDEEKLRSMVSQSPMAHVPIRKARLSANSFAVEIE